MYPMKSIPPLNTIRLEAKALADGLIPPEEAGGNIINEVDSLKTIVYDLDWLAESDSGEYRLKPEEYSIAKLITEEVKRCGEQSRQQGDNYYKNQLP